MMKFVSANEYSTAVVNFFRNAKQNDELKCAVAFWGKDAFKMVEGSKAKIKIICNLDSGATNPSFVSKIMSVKMKEIKNHGHIHAKVYLSNDCAIIGSANASANGLGFADNETKGWLEAGIFTDDKNIIDEANNWFNEIWQQSTNITKEDIRKAEKQWKKRRQNRPTTSFKEYSKNNFAKLKDIRVVWWNDINPKFITTKEKVIEAIGTYNKEIEDRIQNGIDISADEDFKYIPPGNWILWFKITTKGNKLAKRKNAFAWLYVGNYIPSAGKYEQTDDKQQPAGVIIESDNPPPPPFEVGKDKDPIFWQAFNDTIMMSDFRILLSDDEEYFFRETKKVIPKFWTAIRDKYNELKKDE